MIKAQLQAISIVLITGIVISLAGAAYFWGKPLMDKRTTMTSVTTGESFILLLNKEILDVARNRGEKTLAIPVMMGSGLRVNDSENSIVFTFIVDQPMVLMGGESVEVPIESSHKNPIGTYGQEPRIITIRGEHATGQYLMTIKMLYRTLYTDSEPRRGYVIDLIPSGSGDNKVTVSYKGTETEIEPDGTELQKTLIQVDIS